jgi:type I restriction enzyme S subunit
MSDLIPNGWIWNKVNQFTSEHKQGYYTKDAYTGKGTYLIRITDMNNPRIDYTKMPKLEIDEKEYSQFKVEIGDFLFARSGAIGRYGIVEEEFPAVFASYLIRFRFDNEQVSTRYFGYTYESDLCQRQLGAITQGSSNININADNIKSLSIPLPPLPEQQKIAAILSSVDEVIEKTQAQINKLKDLKTGMMQELLSPREGQAANVNNPQGESKNGLHHTEFKDSPLGRIPVGWEIVTLDDLIKSMDGGVSVNGDNRQKNTDEIGVLKVSSVFKGRFLPNNHKAVIKEDEARVKLNPLKDRILFSRANTPELVGESGYIDKDYKDLFLPDKIWMIDVKDRAETNVKWLSYVLCSGQVRKTIADVATGTSGSMKNISKPNLLGIRIALPSFSEQVRIAAAVQSVDDNLYLTVDKLEHTKSIKKALMQDLLTGKVRVKVEAA